MWRSFIARSDRSVTRVLPIHNIIACLALGFGALHADAAPFETKANQAYMLDAGTGTVLFERDAGAIVPPASLAKIMTLAVVFEEVRVGRLSLDQTFTVSENAWRTGGAPSGTSTMFAALKSTIRLGDLLQGVAVQAANDGCIVIAEGIAGSEAKFAELMNARAAALGLTGTTFRNATGLPAQGQVTTMRDLALLGAHVWRTYPELFKLFGQPEFTWNKITQRNRNPLLRMEIGADGMALGFAEGFGFSILGSVERDGRRIFAAIGGLASDKVRAEEARLMLQWGLDGFDSTEIFAAGQIVGAAAVFGGARSSVVLKTDGPIRILLPKGNTERVQARIVYHGPVAAPVQAGAPIGSLTVSIGQTVTQRTPLYAAESVAAGSLTSRAMDAVGELLVGWLR